MLKRKLVIEDIDWNEWEEDDAEIVFQIRNPENLFTEYDLEMNYRLAILNDDRVQLVAETEDDEDEYLFFVLPYHFEESECRILLTKAKCVLSL